MSGLFAAILATSLSAGGDAPSNARTYFGAEAFDDPVACALVSLPMPPQPLLTDFQATWYLKTLSAAQEPSLHQRSREPDAPATYRFTWLRSFDAPVTIRIERLAGGEMRLIAKRLSGHGGYGPGKVADTIDRALSPAERDLVEAVLVDARPDDIEGGDCRLVADGAQWIFEAAVAGDYHLAVRTSPADGPMRKTGEAFIALTGWTAERVY